MATYTPNLNLKKPSTGERYDVIGDLNDAKDKIDNHVGEVNAQLAQIALQPKFTENTDITSELNELITNNPLSNIKINNGTYLINANANVLIQNDIKLVLDKNTTLQAISNSADVYTMLKIENKKNVKIEGGKIIGERNTHTGTTGEWGFGISIVGGENIHLKGINVSDCWGDGLYITKAFNGENSKNILVEDCVFDNNRRNGVSLTGADNVVFKRTKFINSNGTSPEAGVDIEPNLGDTNKNIRFEDCYFGGNKQAQALNVLFRSKNVTFHNCTFEALEGAESSSIKWDGTGNDVFTSCRFLGPAMDLKGVKFKDCEFESTNMFTKFDTVVSAINDNSVILEDCKIIADGVHLLRLTTSYTEETRKIMRNCTLIMNGNVLPDMSDIAFLGQHFTLENCSFIHTGTKPTSGYKLNLNTGREGIINNVYVDETFNYQYGTAGRYSVNTTKKGVATEYPRNSAQIYEQGEVIFKKNPTAGGKIGWICTSGGRAHLPSQGYTTNGSNRITGVTNRTDWFAGQSIKGAGIPEGATVVLSSSDYLDISVAATETGARDLYDAVFKEWGAIDL